MRAKIKAFAGIFVVAVISTIAFINFTDTASAALYATYADVSNTQTLAPGYTREAFQIFKMPVQGKINSIQIKGIGIDGGGTAEMKTGVCLVANNLVGEACVGSYIWANESPYIMRSLSWYTYTFSPVVYDKNALVKFYLHIVGAPAIYEQAYAAVSPSSTYADGVAWINRPITEINADIQILVDISPCRDSFSGHVYSTSTNEAIAGADVRMILKDFVATNESCTNFLAAHAGRSDVFCIPNVGAGLRSDTDSAGAYSVQSVSGIGDDFTVQVAAKYFATSTISYNAMTASTTDCGTVSHDFYLEPNNKHTPIVIVPGILGSYLYNKSGEEVWPNIPLMLLPGDDSYLNQLMLDDSGNQLPDVLHSMTATDILREESGSDFMAGLATELENAGYEEDKDLFVFPYDWRLDVDISGSYLQDKINQIVSSTQSEKVDIIAHSMGGLVVKKYLVDHGNENKINKFIDIATPHTGAPKAAKIMLYGDDLDMTKFGFGLNYKEIKKISQNMPAVYQLLPSQSYFDSTLPDSGSYIADLDDYDNNDISGNLDYSDSMQFMENTGRNPYLLSKNDALHNEIDNFNPADYGIKAYNIVGCNEPTIGKIYVLNKEKDGNEYDLRYISGDGTVPLRSAQALINPVQTYYVTGAEHSKLPSFNGVRQLVTAMVTDQLNTFNISQYNNLKSDQSICTLDGWKVSFHSPITLNIYDENNNHLGPNENGDIEMNIAGASYDIIDDNKFAFLPKGHTYRIVGQATDSGTFNARVQNIQNNETTQTQYFNSVPLNSTATNVEYNLDDQTENVAMNVDEDGDQVFEQTIAPSAVLNQVESQDVTKPQTSAVVDGTLGQNNWYVSTTTLTLTGQDEAIGSGILKTEYSSDNGATWQIYTEPVVLSDDGVYNIRYKSTDKAGNIEIEKEIAINIDKTSSTVDIFSPLNNSEHLRSENLDVVYDINDAKSGIATDTIKILADNIEINTSTINLFAYSLGAHTLSISVDDLAGNVTSTTVSFNVTANIDSTIYDVNTLYAAGAINDKADKQLTKDLKLIKMQIEKFGQKKTIIDDKFTEAMNKCTEKKGVDWCNAKLKPRLDRTEYTLDKIYKAIITLQYKLVLAELKQFNKKSWMNLQAYNILKEDVNYLINRM